MSKEILGSFAEEKQTKKSSSPPPTDANATLFVIMREIRDAIKENTEALNSLLTTIVGQTRGVPTESVPALVYKETTTLKQPEQPNIPLPTPSETTSDTPSTPIETTKMLFPEYLENLLAFTDEGTYVKVKPRQFLGSDNFAKIASIIREAHGEYKSAGKESHFRIPK